MILNMNGEGKQIQGIEMEYVGSGTLEVQSFSTTNSNGFTVSGYNHAYGEVGGIWVEYSPVLPTENYAKKNSNTIALTNKVRLYKSITFTKGNLASSSSSYAEITSPVTFDFEYTQEQPSDDTHASLVAYNPSGLSNSSTQILFRIILPSKRYMLLGYGSSGEKYPIAPEAYITYDEYEFKLVP